MVVKCYFIVVLIFISLMICVLSIFSCMFWPFVFFFGEMSIQGLCLFLIWVVSQVVGILWEEQGVVGAFIDSGSSLLPDI